MRYAWNWSPCGVVAVNPHMQVWYSAGCSCCVCGEGGICAINAMLFG